MTTGNDDLVRSSFDAFLRGDLGHARPGHGPRACLARGTSPASGTATTASRCSRPSSSASAKAWSPASTPSSGRRACVRRGHRPAAFEWGLPGGRACMVVTVRDGRIVGMQDYPDRAAARAGAGLLPEPAGQEAQRADRRPRREPEGPLARKVTEVINSGTPPAEQLLREHPELAPRGSATRHGQSRTLLHLVTDWPGNVPEAAAKVRRSPPPAPTSTRASPARTARPRCTGRPAATTSRRSTRCWTRAPTSRPTAQ